MQCEARTHERVGPLLGHLPGDLPLVRQALPRLHRAVEARLDQHRAVLVHLGHAAQGIHLRLVLAVVHVAARAGLYHAFRGRLGLQEGLVALHAPHLLLRLGRSQLRGRLGRGGEAPAMRGDSSCAPPAERAQGRQSSGHAMLCDAIYIGTGDGLTNRRIDVYGQMPIYRYIYMLYIIYYCNIISVALTLLLQD
jgi:hypothetical protein